MAYKARIIVYDEDDMHVETVDSVTYEAKNNKDACKSAVREIVLQLLDRAESVTT